LASNLLRIGKGLDSIIEIPTGSKHIWTDEPGLVGTPRDGKRHNGVYVIPQHTGVVVL